MIVFDDMTTDMLSNKKLNPTLPELLITARKLNISLAFIAKFLALILLFQKISD